MRGMVIPTSGGARRSAGATWAPRILPSTRWVQAWPPCMSISRPFAATKRPLADPRLSRLANAGAGPGGAYVLIGTVEQLSEEVLARRERYGISSVTVFE